MLYALLAFPSFLRKGAHDIGVYSSGCSYTDDEKLSVEFQS